MGAARSSVGQSCAEVQEERQGCWAAEGSLAQHPPIQDLMPSSWHVPQGRPVSAMVEVHKAHIMETAMAVKSMCAVLRDTAARETFC